MLVKYTIKTRLLLDYTPELFCNNSSAMTTFEAVFVELNEIRILYSAKFLTEGSGN
jgi:hypothetical protein